MTNNAHCRAGVHSAEAILCAIFHVNRLTAILDLANAGFNVLKTARVTKSVADVLRQTTMRSIPRA